MLKQSNQLSRLILRLFSVPEPETSMWALFASAKCVRSWWTSTAGAPRGRCLTLKPPSQCWHQNQRPQDPFTVFGTFRIKIQRSLRPRSRTAFPAKSRRSFLSVRIWWQLVISLGSIGLFYDRAGIRRVSFPHWYPTECHIQSLITDSEICTPCRIPMVQVSPALFPRCTSSSERTLRTHWMSKRQQKKWHFRKLLNGP